MAFQKAFTVNCEKWIVFHSSVEITSWMPLVLYFWERLEVLAFIDSLFLQNISRNCIGCRMHSNDHQPKAFC